MKKYLLYTPLMIAFCTILRIQLCAQTDSVKYTFCHTPEEVKFYLARNQRAKEYATTIILLNQKIKTDSLQDFILKGKAIELSRQLAAKDTILYMEDQKKQIITMERDKAKRQKTVWKVGFFTTWAAFISIFIYSEVRK